MKKKLTTLLFGLLLAVGWTSSVFAQSSTFTANEAKNWTYDWVEGSTTHHDVDPTLKVTNPTQMYYFLRHIYMDERFPGPHYSAYKSDGTTRERKVYYGSVAGGWDIPGNTSAFDVFFRAGTNTAYGTSVTSTKNGVTVTITNTHNTGNNGFRQTPYRLYQGPLTISAPSGYKITKVRFVGYRYNSNTEGDVYPVSRMSGTGYSYSGNSGTWTGSAQTVNLTVNSQTRVSDIIVTVSSTSTGNPEEFYLPDNEGYTLVIIKLKNSLTLIDEDGTYDDTYFTSKEQIINYFTNNVESMQLLTDGVRIGSGQDVGTVFNCPIDEYNRFFFLGKGQAREKAYPVLAAQNRLNRLLGEDVPFKEMFEEFSPSTTTVGQGIDDFYSEMMQGHVYGVVHDCASVIQIEHEFAMSGKTGTTPYKMTGMNIYVPDYRLLYYDSTYTVSGTSRHVDGRDINPYELANSTDKTFNGFADAGYFATWFGNYNHKHQPLVGIYLLSLEAEANPAPGYSESNRYYQSTLDWTSSLNEMSGNGVSQTYIIYQVVTDSVTGELVNVPIDTVENCSEFRPQLTLDTLYEQQAHSYSITYVIQGSPTDSDHPGFIAWSNTATVIIPGYDDFMTLNLHHYESDFDVNYSLEAGKNYYRNYMSPENDFANGITPEAIKGGYDSFILYRTSTDGKVPVAKLKFAVDNQNRVLYKITYFDENEDYTGPNDINIQQIINNLINN